MFQSKFWVDASKSTDELVVLTVSGSCSAFQPVKTQMEVKLKSEGRWQALHDGLHSIHLLNESVVKKLGEPTSWEMNATLSAPWNITDLDLRWNCSHEHAVAHSKAFTPPGFILYIVTFNLFTSISPPCTYEIL